jgi:beta-galactosidase
MSTLTLGFRRVEVIGNELLVNGQPVTIYGINRHDFHPNTGRVMDREYMRQDLLELKRWNFNAIRTAHYPNDPALLDLCDELGFYAVGEANIESHAFQNTLCDDSRYLNAWVDRVARMIQRDIHHPSVILWSLGNESGAGLNHRAAASYARSFDPTRPLHYEGAIRGNWTKNHDLTDVVCPMYPEISAIVSFAKSKKADRPLIMCEYAHAMGNGSGTLSEYWEAIHNTKGLQGGFIWEMWDHGLNQRLEDGSIRSAYGGDFGETRHDLQTALQNPLFRNFDRLLPQLNFAQRMPRPVALKSSINNSSLIPAVISSAMKSQ